MKVSIVTAVYNSENTIAQAVSSVAMQDYQNIEHLIIDGNSTDKSLSIINDVAHPRMTIVSEQDNGIYDALNKGVALATGDVVGFLHSDDFLAHKSAISRIAEAFEEPDVEAVYADLDYVSKSDDRSIVRHWSNGEFSRWRLKLGWMPAHPTLYLRRSVYARLGGFDTSFKIAADYDFILRYFSELNAKSVYIPETIYKMRVGGESNRDFDRIKLKSIEDLRAIRQNGVGGIGTLAAKNLSKVVQFLPRLRQN